MNISFLHKPLGCLLFILLLFVLASTIVSCAVDVVQVNIIKRFSPGYKTWAETAKEEKEKTEKEKEEKKKTEEKKIKNIEGLLKRELNLQSLYNYGQNPDILFLNEKEIYAIVYLEKFGHVILIKTIDGGKSWKIILSSDENQYFGRLSAKSVGEKKIITVYIDFIGAIYTKSEDGGKTWKFFNSYREEIDPPPMENNRILVHLPNY